MAAERYPHSASSTNPSLSKYIWRFALCYVGFSLLIIIVCTVIDYEPPSALGFITLWGAANIAGYVFYNDKQRLPEKVEIRKFSFFGLFIAYLLSAIVAAILIAADDGQIAQVLQTLSGWILGAIILVIAIPVYFSCSLGFSMGAKGQLKADKQKAKDGKSV